MQAVAHSKEHQRARRRVAFHTSRFVYLQNVFAIGLDFAFAVHLASGHLAEAHVA